MDNLKLHLGCGTVYLDGYVNIDADEYRNDWHRKGFDSRDDAIEFNRTILEQYYKRTFFRIKGYYKDSKIPVVADMYGDIRNLYSFFVEDKSVDEIIAYQVIEHFRQDEIMFVLKHWYEFLKKGGIFRVDVPDIVNTIKMINEVNPDIDWILRLIYGTGNNQYCVHYDGYYREKLRKMLESIGYSNIELMKENIHDYPAFGFVCTK
jgi:SAM-dependent methyltransferase